MELGGPGGYNLANLRRKIVKRRIGLLVMALGISPWLWGQDPQGRGTATTMLAGKKITIDYGQPALKGRKFAELTKNLPGDRMWRAGSGIVTTLATEADLLVGGKKVPAGKYSVYVHCPESGSYSLVLNRDLGQPLGKLWAAAPASQANEPYPHFEYAKEIADKEVARVPLKQTSGSAADILTYSFKPSGNGTSLTIAWGDQAWAVEVQPAK
jgi:hypothetical protein